MVHGSSKPMKVARWLFTVPLLLCLCVGMVQQSVHRHDSGATETCVTGHAHGCHAHPQLHSAEDSSHAHHGSQQGHKHQGSQQDDASCAVCQFLAQSAAPGIWRAELGPVAAVWLWAEAECPAVRATIVAFYSCRAPPLQSSGLDLT